MKGRKPKLFAVSEAEGNPGKRKRPAPVVVTGDFDPPFPLGEVGMSEWKRIRSEAPWISAASAGALWMRCARFEDLMKARADIQKRGRLLATRNGSVKNPSIQIEREAFSFVLKSDIEMGLTACSQQKIATLQRPESDALEDALCG